MFRKIYKNANNHIDSSAAYERVKKRVFSSERRHIYRPMISVAACLAVVVAGMSAYQKIKPAQDSMVMPANDMRRTVGEPAYDTADMAQTEKMSASISIEEETAENFNHVQNDPTYRKRTYDKAAIFEKTEDGHYECWIEKNGKVTKISAQDISEEEKEDIISSFLQ